MNARNRSAGDPMGTAMALRTARALPQAERASAIQAIAERVVVRYRAALATGQSLRDLGGWSVLIGAELGAQPAAEANEIGMATNDAFWRWSALKAATPEIRNAAVTLFNAEAAQ